MELTIRMNKQDLERLEDVIKNNIGAFYEVGRALIEIRDNELYKIKNGGECQIFEAYCSDVWDMSRGRSYQLIDAAEIKDNLSTTVDITERRIRPLSRLEPEQQKVAWQRAIDIAPDGKVTTAHVYKIVKGMTATGSPSEVSDQSG